MAPDQRGEVGEVVVADVHAVRPDLLNGFLHVDGVPVHDGVEGEAEASELLFLPLPKGASDFAAFAMVNAPAEAVTQLGVVKLGQDAPPECRVVDIAQNVEALVGFRGVDMRGSGWWFRRASDVMKTAG